MKYIINEDKNTGIQPLNDELRKSFLKSLGYTEKETETVNEAEVAEGAEEVVTESKMAPRQAVQESEEPKASLYEWNGQYFKLEEDVYEFENELYVRVQEMTSEEAHELTEGKDSYTNWVSFDGKEYSLKEACDYDDDVYIKMQVNEELSDDDIDDIMNKSAEKKFGKDSDQAKAHKSGARNAPAKGDKPETPEEKAKAKADAEKAAGK